MACSAPRTGGRPWETGWTRRGELQTAAGHGWREDKNSSPVVSDGAFTDWSRTFTDPRFCSAIVDRLTFNATLIDTGTESYRLAGSKANQTKQSS
ncbi:ATP-binding protein [Streptomyces jeddahensis]|uniref:Transposase n=1 Tax=Streptomyces jeddahensis TaxID=1716141 RepID=A0A177HVA5_9ACTN|nr:ATP-binding protein [Streptomyces jeddahensis]OAH14646.1 transposase [Streptomyces jeddahensis]